MSPSMQKEIKGDTSVSTWLKNDCKESIKIQHIAIRIAHCLSACQLSSRCLIKISTLRDSLDSIPGWGRFFIRRNLGRLRSSQSRTICCWKESTRNWRGISCFWAENQTDHDAVSRVANHLEGLGKLHPKRSDTSFLFEETNQCHNWGSLLWRPELTEVKMQRKVSISLVKWTAPITIKTPGTSMLGCTEH